MPKTNERMNEEDKNYILLTADRARLLMNKHVDGVVWLNPTPCHYCNRETKQRPYLITNKSYIPPGKAFLYHACCARDGCLDQWEPVEISGSLLK